MKKQKYFYAAPVAEVFPVRLDEGLLATSTESVQADTTYDDDQDFW